MNMLAEEKIIWTVPAPAWARRLMRELRSLTERQGKRREEIVAQLPLLLQYRLTFSSVSMNEEAKREVYLSKVREWFAETYGLDPGQYNQWFLDVHVRKGSSRIDFPKGDELSREDAAAAFGVLRDIASWATLMVCLRKVEQRSVPMHDLDSAPVWVDAGIPSEWKDFHAFMQAFPRQLFLEAAAVCEDLNPGVWTVPMDEDSKNFGGVNVRG